MTIVSHTAFMWTCSFLISFACIARIGVELVRWRRNLRPEVPRDDVWRDKIFGHVMGLIIVAIGLAGVIKYHLR